MLRYPRRFAQGTPPVQEYIKCFAQYSPSLQEYIKRFVQNTPAQSVNGKKFATRNIRVQIQEKCARCNIHRAKRERFLKKSKKHNIPINKKLYQDIL